MKLEKLWSIVLTRKEVVDAMTAYIGRKIHEKAMASNKQAGWVTWDSWTKNLSNQGYIDFDSVGDDKFVLMLEGIVEAEDV